MRNCAVHDFLLHCLRWQQRLLQLRGRLLSVGGLQGLQPDLLGPELRCLLKAGDLRDLSKWLRRSVRTVRH